MNALLTAFRAVFPPTMLIIVGYISRLCKIVTEDDIYRFNQLCYNVLISAVVFHNVYKAEITVGECTPLLLFCVLGILAECFLAGILIKRIEPSPDSQATMIQALFRTNVVIMGLPLAQSIYTDCGLMGAVYSVMVPMFNVLAVILFETHRNQKVESGKIALSILKNPLIIASIAAIMLKCCGIHLPELLTGVISNMAGAGSCIVLILLGASLEMQRLHADRRKLIICLIGRLAVEPMLALLIAAALGFRGLPLLCVLVVFGCPVATTSHVIAQQMGGDGDLAGEVLAMSVVCSCFTMFGWIYLLSSLALL